MAAGGAGRGAGAKGIVLRHREGKESNGSSENLRADRQFEDVNRRRREQRSNRVRGTLRNIRAVDIVSTGSAARTLLSHAQLVSEDKLREWQIEWTDRYKLWLDWIVRAFALGAVLFLLAIASLLIPAEGPWDMSGLRVAAVALVLVAALAELFLRRIVERGNGGGSAPKEQHETIAARQPTA